MSYYRSASAQEPPAPESWWRRWGGKLYQGIIAVGAIAAAIAAGIALRPARDVEDAAAITAVARPGVLLREYSQRFVPPHPQPVSIRRLANVEPSPDVTDPGDGSDEETADPENSEPATGEATITASTGPESPATSESAVLVQPFPHAPAKLDSSNLLVIPVPEKTGNRPLVPHVLEQIDDLGRGLGLPDADAGTVASLMATSVLTDTRNTAGTPDETVAERAVELKHMRTVKIKGTKKRELVGVVVSVNMELSGLRGKEVMLSWSMWQDEGSRRLYDGWLNERLAYRLKPTTNHDTASLDFWIPLPKQKGSYTVRARLAVSDITLVTAETEHFR